MAGTELLRDDDAEVLQRLYCQYIYVTEGATGSIARVDAETGAITLLAGGLPPSIVGIGRAIDVAFIRGTAYVLVTLVARTWAEAAKSRSAAHESRLSQPPHQSAKFDLVSYADGKPR